MVKDFCFYFFKYLHINFFLYFSVISFGFLGNGPRHITYIRNIACECATEHLTTQHVRFVPEFHLYFKVFPIILCCEASIIKHGLISNLIEGMKWHLCLDFYRISVYLINIYQSMSRSLVIPDQCKLKETMASISGAGRIRFAEENR